MAGGKQQIMTLDGFKLPLEIKNGLAYLKIRPFTDKEWETLTHITLTSDEVWDPTSMDYGGDNGDTWYDTVQEHDTEKGITVNWCELHTEDIKDELEISRINFTHKPDDYTKLKDYFLGASEDVIRRTFEVTTQYARAGWITGNIYNTYKNSANCYHHKESCFVVGDGLLRITTGSLEKSLGEPNTKKKKSVIES